MEKYGRQLKIFKHAFFNATATIAIFPFNIPAKNHKKEDFF